VVSILTRLCGGQQRYRGSIHSRSNGFSFHATSDARTTLCQNSAVIRAKL
jgi:hypothetical protein